MELVIVEERKNKHYAYADNGKNELPYKVIIAVALIVISIGIACRKHHNHTDSEKYKNDYAKRKVKSHANGKQLSFFHLSLTSRTDKKLFFPDLLLRVNLFIIYSVYISFKHHSFLWSQRPFLP